MSWYVRDHSYHVRATVESRAHAVEIGRVFAVANIVLASFIVEDTPSNLTLEDNVVRMTRCVAIVTHGVTSR